MSGQFGHMQKLAIKQKAGSLKMYTALEYSTRVVQEGGRRCKKSTLNDLVHLTPLRIPLMNPPKVLFGKVDRDMYSCTQSYILPCLQFVKNSDGQRITSEVHGLINYIDTKAKCRHLKN